MVRTYSDRTRHASDQPDADGHEVDRRHAAHVHAQTGEHEEPLRQQPEHHRTDGIGDPIDDDVDGVLDRRPVARGIGR